VVAVRAASLYLADVSCSLTPSTSSQAAITPAVGFTPESYSGMRPNARGIIEVPPLGLRVSFGHTDILVQLVITCVRATGDAPLPLVIEVQAIQLQMQLCSSTPLTRTASGSAFPDFSIG
jgi:hypothetical protein